MLKKILVVIGLCATALLFPSYAEATTYATKWAGQHATRGLQAYKGHSHRAKEDSRPLGAILAQVNSGLKFGAGWRRPLIFTLLLSFAAGWAAALG